MAVAVVVTVVTGVDYVVRALRVRRDRQPGHGDVTVEVAPARRVAA